MKSGGQREKRGIPLDSLLSPPAGFCLLGVILIGAYLFGDGFTFLFALFVVLAVINGYWIGAAKIGALLGGLLAGAVIGIPAGKALEGVYAGIFNTSGAMNRIISIALTSLVVFLIVTAALQFLIKRKLKDYPGWKPYDRVTGAGLGLLEGALVSCLAVWALLGLEPIAAMSLAQTGTAKPNPVSSWIVSTAEKARGSAIGHAINSTNPLSETRFLTLLADGMTVVNDPTSREAFLKHPAMKRIEEHPSVQEALRLLREDEALCDTLESGETGAILRAIISSQTLLNVIDETDIVSELTPLAKEIELAIREAKAHRSE